MTKETQEATQPECYGYINPNKYQDGDCDDCPYAKECVMVALKRRDDG